MIPGMGQFNIRLNDNKTTAFDALAARRGLERPELVRLLIDEALQADAQGRELFDRSRDFDPSQLGELLRRLNDGLIETDRKMTDIAKREGEVAKLRRDDAERMSAARTELLGSISTRLTKAFEPFRAELDALAVLVRELPGLARVTDPLARIEKLAAEPRQQTVYQFNGIDFLGWKMAAAGFVAATIGALALYALGFGMPGWVGYPMANRYLGGGSQAICTLANYQLNRHDCRMQIDSKGRAVLVFGDPSPPKSRK